MADLYDVHTHVGLDQAFWLRGWWPYAASARDLMAHMNTNGINRAVCFPFTMPSAYDACAFADDDQIRLLPGHIPFARENLALLRECERFDGNCRLLPFAMFDPYRMVDEQVAQLRLLTGRIAGLKTQTTIIQSPILSLLDQGRPLMTLAEELGLPVLLHTSVEPRAVWAQATDCLAVAESFPNVRFSLAHSLGFDREFLARAAQMPNVWVDCAAFLAACDLARSGSPIIAPVARQVDVDYTQPQQVLVAVHEILCGCYLWGSDHPFMSWYDDELQMLHTYQEEASVLHALPEVVRVSLASVAPKTWLFGEEARNP